MAAEFPGANDHGDFAPVRMAARLGRWWMLADRVAGKAKDKFGRRLTLMNADKTTVFIGGFQAIRPGRLQIAVLRLSACWLGWVAGGCMLIGLRKKPKTSLAADER